MGNTRKSQSMSILTVVGHEVFRSTNSLSALSMRGTSEMGP